MLQLNLSSIFDYNEKLFSRTNFVQIFFIVFSDGITICYAVQSTVLSFTGFNQSSSVFTFITKWYWSRYIISIYNLVLFVQYSLQNKINTTKFLECLVLSIFCFELPSTQNIVSFTFHALLFKNSINSIENYVCILYKPFIFIYHYNVSMWA